MQCSFCLCGIASLELDHHLGEAHDVVQFFWGERDRLLVGPGVSICGDCLGRCVRELQARRVKGWRRWWDLRPGPRVPAKPAASLYRAGDTACSFCGGDGIDETIVAEHARICPPCVRLALDIIREEARRT
jgi:hypothetical protein